MSRPYDTAKESPESTTPPPVQTPVPAESDPVAVIPFAAVKSRLDFWQHEADPGWIYLCIFVAIENTSSEYQHFEMASYSPQLVAGEGYSYPVERGYLTTKQLIPPGFRVWADAAPAVADLNFQAEEAACRTGIQLDGSDTARDTAE